MGKIAPSLTAGALVFAVGATLFIHGRPGKYGPVMIVDGESGKRLADPFVGVKASSHFAKANWREAHYSHDREESRDGMLWSIGEFLGVVGTVHAQSGCIVYSNCVGNFVIIEQQPCLCDEGVENVDTPFGTDFNVGSMWSGSTDCDSGCIFCDMMACDPYSG